MWKWSRPMAAKRTGFMVSLSPFEAGGGDALNQQALEEDEEAEDRQQRQDRHGEQRAPIGFARRIDEAAQAELHGIGVDVVEIDEGPEKIVPGEDEGEDGGGRQGGQRQRQDDPPVDAERPAAIDLGGVVELARDGAEEL